MLQYKQVDKQIKYSFVTVTFFAEMLKLCVSCVMIATVPSQYA